MINKKPKTPQDFVDIWKTEALIEKRREEKKLGN